jgi:uncharacterized membrane protein
MLRRQGLFALAALVLLLAFVPASSATAGSGLVLKVYSDGYVHVTQTFGADPNATSVEVPILSPVVSDLVATDQSGSPLSYEFASGGSNLTVYTIGASSVTLNYDTNAITSKNGTVWTLSFATGYNSTVVLPQLSTLSSVSGTPYSINETDSSPELGLPPGGWTISYGVSIGSITSTTSSTASQGMPGRAPLVDIEVAAALVLAVIAVGVFFAWWRRRPGALGGDLRPDDVQVLGFIREKGGRVLEPEIRMKFALPKTSAWRQIKRLERLGYVKVTKLGSQNQIEIVKDRAA